MKEKLEQLGWEFCSASKYYITYQHPRAKLFFVFEEENEYGIVARGRIIHSHLTEAELEEYTRLIIGFAEGDSYSERTEAKVTARDLSGFIKRMKEKQ